MTLEYPCVFCSNPMPASGKICDECQKRINAKKSSTRQVTLTGADTIIPRQLEWAWDEMLPMGTLGLMAGREDLGKTQELLWVAAQLTLGKLPGAFFMQRRCVLIAADEDSWDTTIVPRLMAAGADLTLIKRVDVTTTEGQVELVLPSDLTALKAEIMARGDVAMLLLDPLLSKLSGKLNTHVDAEVRRALHPLRVLAEDTGIIVIGIIHVNKSTGTDPANSIMGSRAFTAVARFVHFIIQDPNDESLRLLGMVKNNLGPKRRDSLVFTIEGVTLSGGIKTSRLVWKGTDPRTIRQILQENAAMTAPTKTGDAARWLKGYLATNGKTDSAQIKQDAIAAGYTDKTLRSARQQLSVVVTYGGVHGQTFWELPQPTAATQPVFVPGGGGVTI